MWHTTSSPKECCHLLHPEAEAGPPLCEHRALLPSLLD